jgi:hypothetical protein
VFVQNLLPGAMGRLGLDAPTLREKHPGSSPATSGSAPVPARASRWRCSTRWASG